MRRTCLVALLVYATCAHGTRLDRVPMERLFEQADLVVSVQVMNGEPIDPTDLECGWQYKGKIEESFKGDAGTEVNFGRIDGLELGGRYLLFLTKPEREYRELASTNSISRSLERQRYEKCHSKWTVYSIMQGFAGAMLMSSQSWEDWIEIPSQFIELPSGPGVSIRPHGLVMRIPTYADPVWVYGSDIVDYLNALRSKATGSRTSGGAP
ncbi:MAG: hypothetical protein HY749_18810 [Gammaproteobacteria bacterium]|nr:hypothetical protein [Gammaproteobacteria bacterium]